MHVYCSLDTTNLNDTKFIEESLPSLNVDILSVTTRRRRKLVGSRKTTRPLELNTQPEIERERGKVFDFVLT